MSSAITPARRKKTKEEIRYMYPIVLWSVEVSHPTIFFPLDRGTTCGAGRARRSSAVYS